MQPNRLQELILRRLTLLGEAEGVQISDAEAARRCDMKPSTFGDMLRDQRGTRQIVDPAHLPKIANGLGIPIEDLLDAAAYGAGYRRQTYDESDLTSVVRYWLSDDLTDREVRNAMREARDALQRRLDDWSEKDR